MDNETQKLTYKQSGVDTEKAADALGKFSESLKKSKQSENVMTGLGPFASAYRLGPVLKNYTDPCLVTCCDGVGTKVLLAQQWNRVEGLGIDLVAMSVNDLLCLGATPLVFLDYYACGAIEEPTLLGLLESIRKGCELARCDLVGGETAEMPDLYRDKDFDLAGFAVGMVDQAKILGPTKVTPGDRLIAIASNGIHSNGYSLVRKLLERHPLVPSDSPDFSDRSWSEILLRPTEIYVQALVDILPKLNALTHVTGGGIYENLPRALSGNQTALINPWPLPPLFHWLKNQAKLSAEELLSTFNCGVGMIAIASAGEVDGIVSHVKGHGIEAWEMGEVQLRESAAVPTIQWTTAW